MLLLPLNQAEKSAKFQHVHNHMKNIIAEFVLQKILIILQAVVLMEQKCIMEPGRYMLTKLRMMNLILPKTEGSEMECIFVFNLITPRILQNGTGKIGQLLSIQLLLNA